MLRQSKKHQWIAIVLALLMTVTAVPLPAVSAEEGTQNTETQNVETVNTDTREKAPEEEMPEEEIPEEKDDLEKADSEIGEQLIRSFSELPEEIRFQKAPVGTGIEEFAFPEQLEAVDADANVLFVPVTWEADTEYQKDAEGEYLFKPVVRGGGISLQRRQSFRIF